ncbi:4-hydroxy-3-methylbut-2-en-1-yl diphosphate synthase (flavodoxin) [Spirochaetia bacterium]|nr:4-hydroxy-3-methylbut-2-en-1-yl diphosphate synthase (flavodoxin) [Spirochaetia bacterium]
MVKRKTRPIQIGGFDHVEPVIIGGDFPVAIQSMWKDPLPDTGYDELISRINRLHKMGCKILRFAVPDESTASRLGEIAAQVSMPLVADIHFDYKIALHCLDVPIAKIRINPGNIGIHTEAILQKAACRNIPVRIGINAGSLPPDLREMPPTDALVKAAERELEYCEKRAYKNIILSVKASSIDQTVEVNRRLAHATDVPLHIGLTEAGPLVSGVVKSTVALWTLLSEGIGDTIRVSLSDSPENEIIAAKEILRTVGQEEAGVEIISCPKCGRNSFDTHAFTEKWIPVLYSINRNLTIAIMGCAVNGPGEAKHADLGITGAGDSVLLFRHGKIIRTLAPEEADKAFEEELLKAVD